MLIKPNYNCAIVVYYDGLAIEFSNIPDMEVVAEIYDLEKNTGMFLPIDRQKKHSYGDSVPAATSKLDLQRLYYWVTVSRVYESLQVANLLALELCEKHQLVVKVVDERMTDDTKQSIKIPR